MYSRSFNPGAQNFNPNNGPKSRPHESSVREQVSAPPSPYLEARILHLEEGHADLRADVDVLKDMYHDLCNSMGSLSTGDRSGPFLDSARNADPVKSRQSALQFQQELEQLSREVHSSVKVDADAQKTNESGTQEVNGSASPNVRAASVTSHGSGTKSLPPHLRGAKQPAPVNNAAGPKLLLDTTKHKHEPLVTDGPVDTIVRQIVVPEAAPSPPLSPTTTVQADGLIRETDTLSLDEWQPHYLTTLATLPADVRSRIPAPQVMATFTFDMLQNVFGGSSWSPGLRYVKSSGSSVLKNRTYYMLDPTNEPYLPKAPGEHGAKLTAFFNKAPEEKYDNLPEGTNSYTDVPMFIQVAIGRYVYFGNYSQTRWSDKLDNDTMRARVPQHVKDHWAKELTDKVREEWVTAELKKHFFPKPVYEGSVLAPTNDNATVNSVDEEKHSKQVMKDVNAYVEELAEWEREARMKTAMIKPDFILNAFEAADADDPPALRLWWEYLECVDWDKTFYNMLVGMQERCGKTQWALDGRN